MTLRLLVFRDRLVGIDPSLFCSYFALHSVFGFSGRSLIAKGQSTANTSSSTLACLDRHLALLNLGRR